MSFFWEIQRENLFASSLQKKVFLNNPNTQQASRALTHSPLNRDLISELIKTGRQVTKWLAIDAIVFFEKNCYLA